MKKENRMHSEVARFDMLYAPFTHSRIMEVSESNFRMNQKNFVPIRGFKRQPQTHGKPYLRRLANRLGSFLMTL